MNRAERRRNQRNRGHGVITSPYRSPDLPPTGDSNVRQFPMSSPFATILDDAGHLWVCFRTSYSDTTQCELTRRVVEGLGINIPGIWELGPGGAAQMRQLPPEARNDFQNITTLEGLEPALETHTENAVITTGAGAANMPNGARFSATRIESVTWTHLVPKVTLEGLRIGNTSPAELHIDDTRIAAIIDGRVAYVIAGSENR
jgi:hypothetical protein